MRKKWPTERLVEPVLAHQRWTNKKYIGKTTMTIQETSVIYRAEGETSLKLHLFLPDKNAGRRAAILFFHGGRFIQGHPAQFFPHCRYFASRGMVAASATYRLLGKNARTVLDCFADSRAAIEWLRTHADDLAIDPAQVVLAGGSAGANLAANAAMGLPEEQRNDASRISSAPDALVLFSPAVVRPRAEQDLLDARLYAQLRPRAHLPPMLLLHGGEDEVFALDALQDFCQQMTLAGNICQLQLYPG
ncbi:MAG TPA: alpha/beta hydrolase, partial [Caldilineaceae bacterium]|nr:alpha/beta hydrolase [Caldilineaceae bacterium]